MRDENMSQCFAPIIMRILGSTILRHRALIEHHSHAYRIYCTERLLNGQVFSNKERSVREKVAVDCWISRILLRVVKQPKTVTSYIIL